MSVLRTLLNLWAMNGYFFVYASAMWLLPGAHLMAKIEDVLY